VTKVGGDRDSVFQFTGYFWHAQSSLSLALFPCPQQKPHR
jgi:hypothetical protein